MEAFGYLNSRSWGWSVPLLPELRLQEGLALVRADGNDVVVKLLGDLKSKNNF